METKELLTTVRNTRIGDRKPLMGTVYLRGVNRKVSQLDRDLRQLLLGSYTVEWAWKKLSIENRFLKLDNC